MHRSLAIFYSGGPPGVVLYSLRAQKEVILDKVLYQTLRIYKS